jgi:uncharacterized protein (TIGR00369 family)
VAPIETVPEALAPDVLTRIVEQLIPFNRFLGVRVIELGPGCARLELPYRPEMIGNPLRPALHGGVLATLLDTTGGAAVWTRVSRDHLLSTIDLRVDYLRPARPEPVIARGRVVRLGNRVGVVELRAAHAGEADRPVAAGTGVYSIRRGTSGSELERWREALRSLDHGAIESRHGRD